jgi:pyrroline-5-carboxylate reductase
VLTTKKIGFIGGGAMAEAIVKGMLKAELVAAKQITVSDIATGRLEYLTTTYKVETTTDSREVAGNSDILIFAVKPQVINDVLSNIGPKVPKTTIVISIAAGITISTLEDKLPGVPVVRVMPNTPVSVGEGMAAIALGKHAGKDADDTAMAIFSSVGKAVTLGENAMDAVTGLSGSGPGFAYVLIDALSDAGVRAGLPRQTALTLAAQTLLGSAKMVLETGEHPGKLRDAVTSPGGTTIAGIHVLEQRGVRAALIDAVIAAADRSREMGRK